MRLPSGRLEIRLSLVAQMRISSLANPSTSDIAITQNVSRYGARVAVHREWRAEEMVLVSAAPAFSALAKIVYCQKIANQQFVAGIRLEGVAESWFASLEKLPR
jgi:hypothetical protein